jgi:hypothetical protein
MWRSATVDGDAADLLLGPIGDTLGLGPGDERVSQTPRKWLDIAQQHG